MKRVRNLIKAANAYGFAIPAEYDAMFKQRPEPQLAPADSFRLAAADEALDRIVDELIARADGFISESNLKKPDPQEVNRIFDLLQLMVPAQRCRSLPEILNAAWLAYENDNMWPSVTRRTRAEKEEILKDLILKTIEIFEVEQILEQDQ
jgi:hypothetical protein